METRTKKFWSCWVLLLAVGVGACGGGRRQGRQQRQSTPPHLRSRWLPPSAKSSSSRSRLRCSFRCSFPAPERVRRARKRLPPASVPVSAPRGSYSHVSHTAPDRADYNHPTQLVSLYYNDRKARAPWRTIRLP
jgi:hypothetical protein